VFDVHCCGRHDGKLVTAEAGDGRGNVSGLAQQRRECRDELIAGVLTELVIDYLEAVQIKEQYRDRARLSLGQSPVEVSDQRPAVQQAGEVIVFSKVVNLLFGDDAGLQLSE